MNKAEMFNMLIGKELSENLALIKLNKKIMELENRFKEKHGDEVFHDYYEIAELAIEELSECITFSFEMGRKTAL